MLTALLSCSSAKTCPIWRDCRCAPRVSLRVYCAQGSVALDGVSLTVNEVEGDTFSVLLIPHTLKVTTFGALRAGARLNLEVDQMARYAARLLDTAGLH